MSRTQVPYFHVCTSLISEDRNFWISTYSQERFTLLATISICESRNFEFSTRRDVSSSMQRKLYKKIISRIEILKILREQLYIYFSAKTIENWNFEFESVVNSIRLLSHTWKPLKIEISNLHAVQAWKLSEIEIFTHPEDRLTFLPPLMRKLSRILNREEYSFLLLRIRKIEILNFPRVAKDIRLTFLSLRNDHHMWKSKI